MSSPRPAGEIRRRGGSGIAHRGHGDFLPLPQSGVDRGTKGHTLVSGCCPSVIGSARSCEKSCGVRRAATVDRIPLIVNPLRDLWWVGPPFTGPNDASGSSADLDRG